VSKLDRKNFVTTLGLGSAALLAGCSQPQTDAGSAAASAAPVAMSSGEPAGGNSQAIIASRGLTPGEIDMALRTYVPPGKHDDFVMFASGGHSGQVVVMGIPSMRILRSIAVFTPDSYSGWGYDESSKGILDEGAVGDLKIRHGDTHHPALSETAGDYDGEFLFINDKVNARVAVIDLKSFEVRQIVKNPHMISDHGHCVTPDTEYIIETSQYAAPIGWGYVPLTRDNYKHRYRGCATYWKFDRAKGKIDPSCSFSIELPPFFQDLSDAGKLGSHGWSFTNSYNSELAIPEFWKGGLPAEASMSQNAYDWLHVINWKKAEALFKAGNVRQRNGMALITLEQAGNNGILFLVQEAKSPHGVDVSPDGKFIAIGGKLDPHVQIYSFEKIEAATRRGDLKRDPNGYGIPVLPLKDILLAQIGIGLGPLHTVFDGKGFGYTSLFLDSAVAKWKIGDADGHGWEMVDKTPLEYNTGHLAAPHGDTVKPRGKYVVGLNKWSLDRFTPVGPFYPRNLQLVDVESPKMSVIFDGAMGIAEPHYAQIIDASLLKPLSSFPQGYDTALAAPNPNAPKPGDEGVKDHGDHVVVQMTQVRSHFAPDVVQVKRGQRVVWSITNIEGTKNAMHGFALSGYNMSLTLEPGKMQHFEFVADTPGVFPYYCTDFCSALHLEMMGYLLVS
jgi:nitrous-oxide reductase